jgi:hypothetical protein
MQLIQPNIYNSSCLNQNFNISQVQVSGYEYAVDHLDPNNPSADNRDYDIQSWYRKPENISLSDLIGD